MIIVKIIIFKIWFGIIRIIKIFFKFLEKVQDNKKKISLKPKIYIKF